MFKRHSKLNVALSFYVQIDLSINSSTGFLTQIRHLCVKCMTTHTQTCPLSHTHISPCFLCSMSLIFLLFSECLQCRQDGVKCETRVSPSPSHWRCAGRLPEAQRTLLTKPIQVMKPERLLFHSEPVSAALAFEEMRTDRVLLNAHLCFRSTAFTEV